MSESLFSPLWYRVANLKPTLRGHVQLHRHDYRGLIWYIFEDKSSGRNHRFNSSAYQVIGLLDGNRTVDQIWNLVNESLGEFAPTQDDIIQLLGKLHAGDLLQSGVPPDTEEIFQRNQQHKSSKLKQVFSNPLNQKFPLWDPDQLLERNIARINWMFHWSFGIIWLFVVLGAVMAAAIHWRGLSEDMVATVLSPYNLLIMGILYPIIKLLHELGHAFTTKRLGGEVHEMGVIFLALMPIPYVNVSSSTAFRDKHKRMLVGAAGIAVELFISALALFLWLITEPGIVQDIAYNIVIIGSVSSLFFNGNPLLKYDGYYVLADAIDIPNLYQRSTKFLGYLCQRYLFGINTLTSPASGPGEAKWFVVYGISSFLYRLGILWVIILFVTEKFFVVGVILALWLASLQILLPLVKGIQFILVSPRLQEKRFRAIGATVTILLIFNTIIFLVPIPSYTTSEGIVWMPEEAQLRAETEGFAGQLLANPVSTIEKGIPVVEIRDPLLHTQVEVLRSKLKELATKFRSEWSNDQVQADILKEELLAVKAELKHTIKRSKAMLIHSRKAGKLLVPFSDDLKGRYIRQGELIGYIIDDSEPIVRVMVNQSDIGQVRKHTKKVDIRLANNISRSFSAKIIREAPEATNYLPSAALATIGGGNIKIDPNSKEILTTLEKVFQFDMQFSPLNQHVPIGTRVYVRFDHGSEPLAYQWYRNIRQVFLRQFNV